MLVTMIVFSASFVSQKFDISIATSKHKFESVMIFETVNSSKNSHLTSNASEIVSESMKNESNQCSSAQMFSFSRTLEIKHQDICVQKSSEFCSSFTSFTLNLICEASKKSTIASSSSVSLATSSKQIFESSENRTQKSSIIDLSLSIDTIKSICESEKNSTVTIFKRSCFICRIDVSSIKDHFFESSSCNEALRHRLNQLLARRAHQREQEAQKQVELIEQEAQKQVELIEQEVLKQVELIEQKALKQVEIEKAINSFVSSVCFNLSIATLKIVSEALKSASNQEVTCVRVICKLCKQSLNFNKKLYEHIRNHEALKLVKNSHLSINAVNLVCEIEKTSLASHKFSVSFAKSQKLIFESAIAFRTIILLKSSNLSFSTFEIKSKSTKRSTTCRRCNQIFNFNNKFHEHIRQHHARQFVISKSSDLRIFAFESTYKFIEKSAVSCSSASLTSQFASSIFFATLRNQIFSTKIASRSISSSSSNLSIATHKILSKSMKKLSIKCSLTSSFSSSRTSVRKHQESHIQKSYLIMNDLSRMFIEKSKSFDLRSHQDRSYSSQSFDIRQSSQSCFSIASKKSYLIIENLFEMFDEKFKRKSLFQNQNNVFSRAFSNQMRIIVYFKSAVNQKLSISQNSKSSKSKSLNQHMSAKFIRVNFSKCFEKSIFLSYKMSDIFYIKSRFF